MSSATAAICASIPAQVSRARFWSREYSAIAAGSGGDPSPSERAVVLDDAFERFPGEIETVEGGVSALQAGDHAKALGVVVEAAVRLHQLFERVLAGVAERRMAEIVGKGQRLRQILVGGERPANGAGDLRHFEAVGEPGAEKVALVVDEHLRLVLKPAKRGGVDDAVAIALEAGARPALRLGVQPAAARLRTRGPRCQSIC